MVPKAIATTGRKRILIACAVGLVALPLGTVVLRKSARAQEPVEHPTRAPRLRSGDCMRSARVVPADDPCPALERVHTIVSKLSPSAAEYAQTVASDFNLEGSVRIQQALLREDLVWQQRGLTPRQLNIMVYVAVGLGLQDAEELAKELKRNLNGKADPNVEQRLERLNLFKLQAITFLAQLEAELQDVTDAELRFSF